MPFVVAALVLIGAIAVLNLVLTLAVIRRLRTETPSPGGEARAAEPGSAPFAPSIGVPVGRPVPAFDAADLDGVPIALDGLAENRTLLAFFGADCKNCWTRLPAFVDYVRHTGRTRERVLAVVVGDSGLVTDSVEVLRTVATVAAGQAAARIATALGVHGYPTYILVGAAGEVAEVAFGLEDLPQTVGT